nr:immunoglobulin light chain junction region [Macaca mulatta]MOV34114.1 immunoglobulin light chain junction region [Macaca mulatta]MOV34317.1 immunoglobulin light chain junction region [Macaca mulatta]MOV34588.1 immunoglobulin light chain junction region [Macaca mulatta]MOV34830.1 immunoglobulin light chain junction region [Macaca mulatta]
CQKYSNTPFTF